MNAILELLPYLPLIAIVLSIIVFIHELGHFLVAKKFGVRVEEFGIGLPPRIWGKKHGETLYSINALPIGGFVRLYGETLEEKVEDTKRSFSHKSIFARICISLAGIVMNFILALICFSIFFFGEPTGFVDAGFVTVGSVIPDSPAQTAGVLPGDVIREVNNKTIVKNDDVIEIVKTSDTVKLKVDRSLEGQTEEKEFTIKPRVVVVNDQEVKQMGVELVDVAPVYAPAWQQPFIGAYMGLAQTIEFTRLTVEGLGSVSRQVSQGQEPEGVAGIVAIGANIKEVSKQGVKPIIGFVGLISLSLAVFNLIPFPPLDGSRVVFALAEKVVSKKRLPKIEGYAQSIGMLILLTLMVFITGREFIQLARSNSVEDFVNSFTVEE